MAGDLMYSHAHYAAKPLPCSVPLASVLFGEVNSQPVSARKITFGRDALEDLSTATPHKAKPIPKPRAKKRTVFDRYAAVMSTRKWTSTTDIADALCATSAAVNKYLSANREKIHKRQDNSGKGYLIKYWKLKCDPA